MLEEIKAALKETYLDIANNYDVSDLHHGGDIVACTASKFRHMASGKIEDIIHSYRKNEGENSVYEIKEGYCLIDGVLCETRDDMTRDDLQKALEDIKGYFREHLPDYDVVEVRRKSYHQDDAHLFMVAARKEETFSVWTGWNGSRQTLNHGHYDLPSLEACEKIMDEFYHGEE
ncbi:MAG: hypothetical protein NC548_35245 [Lachnospiraceae bacterium]|nr:hypothetical protein [Lachnospiraceae bacterium]